MYLDYFGLRSRPFSIAPDPRFVFLSDRHREALAHLLYGARESGGFVLLTGEVGTGKTTLCRCLLEQMPENTDVAFIVNPRQNSLEILQSICDELHIPYFSEQPLTLKHLVDRLNEHLLEAHRQGRSTILIIDEAQNLSTDVLEQLRLLTNLETSETKLLRLILLGQPELKEMLSRTELRQLAQRITARYHLQPLDRDEVAIYIEHRLAVAGFRGELFSRGAIAQVYRFSGGIPRIINLLCDRALLGVYSGQQQRVSPATIKQAHRELELSVPRRQRSGSGGYQWLALGAVLLAAAVLAWQHPVIRETVLETSAELVHALGLGVVSPAAGVDAAPAAPGSAGQAASP